MNWKRKINGDFKFDVFQTREFAKAGAFRGNNPADVVQSCDITFTCVSDSVAVRDVSTFLAVD